MGLLQSPLSDALLSPRLRYLWYHSSLCWWESRTSWGLNEIFKLLWMRSRTVCVIHSPHPKRKKPPSYVDGKWFPLSAETLGSMEDPCKTAALLSLGKSVEVPSLKEEWRGSTGYLHLHLGTSWGPVCPCPCAPCRGHQGLQPCCAAEPQSAGGVQHRAAGTGQLCCTHKLLSHSFGTLSLHRFTGENPMDLFK